MDCLAVFCKVGGAGSSYDADAMVSEQVRQQEVHAQEGAVFLVAVAGAVPVIQFRFVRGTNGGACAWTSNGGPSTGGSNGGATSNGVTPNAD